MFKKLVSNAIKDRIGTSKVVDSFQHAYDYVIGQCGSGPNMLLLFRYNYFVLKIINYKSTVLNKKIHWVKLKVPHNALQPGSYIIFFFFNIGELNCEKVI